jgi:GNAT superfamily N-acetyltransferase
MPDVRRLTGQEIDPARRLIAEVFSLHDRLALVALPGDAADKRGQAVWGAFDERGELVSCVVAVVVGDAVTIWSMATDPSRRRQGHGARVLTAALAGHARVRISLLYAPVEAEAFYRSLGYEVLEYWQLLTRRRWLGAA